MAEEIFDIVDEKGQPTGETVTRSQAHAEGIRHRTAHIWVVRENGDKTEVLLQKRAMNKDSFPGRYDTSSAGHIQAGDEPLESAVRELSEELGIQVDPDDLHFAGTFPIQYEKEFHGKPFKDNEIAFVYVYDEEVGIDNLTIQKEELDSVEWFDLEEVYQACQPPRDEKFCVPMGGLEIVRKYVKADENKGEYKMWEMDYDAAASHWEKKDVDSVHMEPAALKEKIEAFIGAHNTCALATASRDCVRNTPIEYNYVDGNFYFFSEGGLKFRGLKENKNVGIAIFEPYGGFGQLKSLQVQGVASMVEPFSDEYLKLIEHKKIPVEVMKKLPQPMNLIKVEPSSFDYLDSELKKDGFGSRQHFSVA